MKKITVVGAGLVGATSVYAMMLKEIADEIMWSRLSAETLFDFIGKIITKKAMQKTASLLFY